MNEQVKDFKGDPAVELTDVVVDRIRKLAELHKAGVLTDEEFSAKKAELLACL